MSATLVNGKPAVAAACWPGFPGGNGNLVAYIESSDMIGSAWETPVYIDEGEGYDRGHEVNLALVSGRPAIAYIAPVGGTFDIRFAIRP
jgi:hypothetical protein